MTPLVHLTDAKAQEAADGLLPEGEASAVMRHLAACAECSAAVESYRLLARALDDLDVPDLPSDFTDGVLARIDLRERAAARERRWALAIFAGVAVATGAAFALAGSSAWAGAFSSAAESLAGALRAVRLASSFVPAVAGALRPQIAVGSAILALPILLALARLMPRPQRQIA